MFERVAGERGAWCGDHLPADDLDGACERLRADLDGVPEWLSDPTDEPMSDVLPEWAINQSEPGFGTCEPSGWLALDLDSATADPHLLDDATLVDAMVGFDRLASWAAARQARLLAGRAAAFGSGAALGAVGVHRERVRPGRGRSRSAPVPWYRLCPDRHRVSAAGGAAGNPRGVGSGADRHLQGADGGRRDLDAGPGVGAGGAGPGPAEGAWADVGRVEGSASVLRQYFAG
jgi:hypothetical protein